MQDPVVEKLYNTGHFWSPEVPEGRDVDPHKLTRDDDIVKAAVRSRMRMQAGDFTAAVIAEHGRAPVFDGEVGPATLKVLDMPRCYVPDYAPPPGALIDVQDPSLRTVMLQMQRDAELPAQGSGNWRGCHGIGNFHACVVAVNYDNIPSHLTTNNRFNTVLKHVQQAYAELGLLFIFVDSQKRAIVSAPPLYGQGQVVEEAVNIDFTFVTSSAGWIGLAIVGQNQGCSSRIWCRYLARYTGGNSESAVITQWVTLIKHELGHNCGRSHTSGGVMNPSIVNGLPFNWPPSDPSYDWLKRQFGGSPIGGNGPLPPVPPEPGDLAARVASLERRQFDDDVRNAVQDALIKALLERN